LKTWEMIKALTENTKLKAKSDNLTVHPVDGGLKYCDCSLRGQHVELSRESLDYEWELVREPVDFMTAINSDKRISTEDRSIHLCGANWLLQNSGLTLAQINGKWYIE